MDFLSKLKTRYQVTAKVLGKGKHIYRVEMSGMARMKGWLEVKANSEAEAEKLAVQHSGDVLWSYQEIDDSTVEAYAIEQ